MEIYPKIQIKGKALYFEEYNSLVISDLQIGYEEQMLRSGTFVPKFQFEDIKKEMLVLLKGNQFDKIIINGDFKHEFGRISEQEWRESLRLIDVMSKHCKEIIFVKGNHDMVLHPIAGKRNISVVDELIMGNAFIMHGDKMRKIPEGTKIIVIGHEHPAIGLQRGPRIEKYKCFLKGMYKKYNLIVLPSFNPLVPGTDILHEKIMSPFIPKNFSDMEVYVIEDKVYPFGKIENL